MNNHRFIAAATALNFAFLVFNFAQIRTTSAQGPAPVLRGRALEIVDDHARVRASIVLQPPDPAAKTADGKPYPDTVVFRLIDPQLRPVVKLVGSEHEGGIAIMGEHDHAYVSMKADETGSFLKLINKDGRQQLIKP